MPNQPTIILFILSVSVFSMLLFPNTLYFSINLLLVVFTTLSFIFYLGLISSLTVLMLLIVYVGAMIILIGYVCAVCPNINLSPTFNRSLFFIVPIFIVFIPVHFMTPSLYSHSFNFFFTSLGSFVFVIVVLILFVILLIVTSYYVSPKGPFRSVS